MQTKEVIAAQAFKIFTECTGEAEFFRRAVAVSEPQAAVFTPNYGLKKP